MTMKAYGALILATLGMLAALLMFAGWAVTLPGLSGLGWILFSLGAVILVGVLASMGFVAMQTNEVVCPHCQKKAQAMVKFSTGQVYLSRHESHNEQT